MAQIFEESPTAIVLLIDLSEEMSQGFTTPQGEPTSRGEEAIKWINVTISAISMRANCGGEVFRSCEIAIFCYSGHGVVSCFGSYDEPFMSVAELARLSPKGKHFELRALTPLDSPDDYNTLMQSDFTVDFYGNRPMLQALYCASEATKKWRRKREQSKILIANFAGGEPTDGGVSDIVGVSKRFAKKEIVLYNLLIGCSDVIKLPNKITLDELLSVILK